MRLYTVNPGLLDCRPIRCVRALLGDAGGRSPTGEMRATPERFASGARTHSSGKLMGSAIPTVLQGAPRKFGT